MTKDVKCPEGFNHYFCRCIYENTKRPKQKSELGYKEEFKGVKRMCCKRCGSKNVEYGDVADAPGSFMKCQDCGFVKEELI